MLGVMIALVAHQPALLAQGLAQALAAADAAPATTSDLGALITRWLQSYGALGSFLVAVVGFLLLLYDSKRIDKNKGGFRPKSKESISPFSPNEPHNGTTQEVRERPRQDGKSHIALNVLLLKGAIVVLYSSFARFNFNAIISEPGLDLIGRLLLQRGIPSSMVGVMLIWVISLLPWVFYRVSKFIFRNTLISNTSGICCAVFLYSILIWRSFAINGIVSESFITFVPSPIIAFNELVWSSFIVITLFLSFFAEVNIRFLRFFAQVSLFLRTKKYDSSYPLDAFSLFMIIVSWIVFLPSFAMISAASLWSLVAWLLAAVLAVLWTGFLLLLVLLSPVVAVAFVIFALGRFDSGSANRESDGSWDDGGARWQEKYWEAKAQQERERKEQEEYRWRRERREEED